MTKKVKIIISSVCAAVILFIIILVSAISCNNKKSNDTPSESSTVPSESSSSSNVNTEVLEFTLSSDGLSYEVTKVIDTTVSNIVIPSTYNGKPVTSIGKKCFVNIDEDDDTLENTTLKSVTIPDSVTVIKSGAFTSCVELETVNILNKDLKFEGSDQFSFCKKVCINYPGTKAEFNEMISKMAQYSEWNYHATGKVVCTDGELKYNDGSLVNE